MTDRETPVVTDEIDALMDDDQSTAAGDAPELPLIVVPDRADAPVSEITERFLRSIVAQVPLDRIEELHLFSPLRQSGVETGIAVVAARVPVVMPAPAVDAPADPELMLESDETVDADVEAEIDVDVDAEIDVDVDAEIDVEVDAEIDVDVDAEADGEIISDDAEQLAADVTELLADEAADDEDVHEAIVTMAPVPIERHTVYTARYRLVQKGPERGKWEADVVAEADAPLITVETVVRGVQRRAGEESEILRYSAKQIAKALHQPWPIVPPPSDVQPESSAA